MIMSLAWLRPSLLNSSKGKDMVNLLLSYIRDTMSWRIFSTIYGNQQCYEVPYLCSPSQNLLCSGYKVDLHHQPIHICLSYSNLHHTIDNQLGVRKERQNLILNCIHLCFCLMITHFLPFLSELYTSDVCCIPPSVYENPDTRP